VAEKEGKAERITSELIAGRRPAQGQTISNDFNPELRTTRRIAEKGWIERNFAQKIRDELHPASSKGG